MPLHLTSSPRGLQRQGPLLVAQAVSAEPQPNKDAQPAAAGSGVFDRDMKFDCHRCISGAGSAAVAELGR